VNRVTKTELPFLSDPRVLAEKHSGEARYHRTKKDTGPAEPPRARRQHQGGSPRDRTASLGKLLQGSARRKSQTDKEIVRRGGRFPANLVLFSWSKSGRGEGDAYHGRFADVDKQRMNQAENPLSSGGGVGTGEDVRFPECGLWCKRPT